MLKCDETKPFIFISYSHRNTDEVVSIIRRLEDEGYNVWFDEGIDPGTEWDENIAQHVLSCSFFLAFISEGYIGSKNCKDELNYSRDLDKEQLLVYLEEVNLPAGMAMRMNRIQSIFWYKYQAENIDDAFAKLFTAPGMAPAKVFELSPELKKKKELQAAERRRAEEARLAEEKRKAEEARLAEEKRKAEEARLAEEKRKAEEARLAEEKRRAEEARLAEEKRKAEEARLADEKRLEKELREKEAAEKERVEQEHLAKETVETESLEKERLEKEKQIQENLEKARIAREQIRRGGAYSTSVVSQKKTVEVPQPATTPESIPGVNTKRHKLCFKCQKLINKDTKTCPACGAFQPAEMPIKIEPEKNLEEPQTDMLTNDTSGINTKRHKLCVKCQKLINKDTETCPACGASQTRMVPKQEAKVSVLKKANYDDDNYKFCISCDKRIPFYEETCRFCKASQTAKIEESNAGKSLLSRAFTGNDNIYKK